MLSEISPGWGGADDLRRRVKWEIRKPSDIPDAVITFRRHKQFDRLKAKDNLKKFLKITPPISLSEAARRLECHSRELYRIAPELCHRIAAKYRKHQKRIYEVKRKNLEKEVV